MAASSVIMSYSTKVIISNKSTARYQEIVQLVVAGLDFTQLFNSINHFNVGHTS